jgi:hypothetical protein
MKNTKSWTGRKIKVWGISLCLFLGIVIIVSTALSDEYKYSFMFTVPVQVQNLSVYAKEVVLFCAVTDENGKEVAQGYTGINYSNNRGAIDSQGGFSGTLTYALKLVNPSEASKAKSYICTLNAGSGGSWQSFKDCDSDTAYFCLKPGTPRTLKIQGSIP